MAALRFVWRPTPAGAPDSDDYAGATDGVDRFRYEGLSGTPPQEPPKTPMTGQGRHRHYDKDR